MAQAIHKHHFLIATVSRDRDVVHSTPCAITYTTHNLQTVLTSDTCARSCADSARFISRCWSAAAIPFTRATFRVSLSPLLLLTPTSPHATPRDPPLCLHCRPSAFAHRSAASAAHSGNLSRARILHRTRTAELWRWRPCRKRSRAVALCSSVLVRRHRQSLLAAMRTGAKSALAHEHVAIAQAMRWHCVVRVLNLAVCDPTP